MASYRLLRAFRQLPEGHPRRIWRSWRCRLLFRRRGRGCHDGSRRDGPGLARQLFQTLRDAAEIGPDPGELPLDPTEIDLRLARGRERSLERNHLADEGPDGRGDGCGDRRGSLDHPSARRLAAGFALSPQPLKDLDRRSRITRAAPKTFRWNFCRVFQCIVAESCIRNTCFVRNVRERQQLSCPYHFFNLQSRRAIQQLGASERSVHRQQASGGGKRGEVRGGDLESPASSGAARPARGAGARGWGSPGSRSTP